MANILGRERRKIKELKAELMRKDQIIMELVEKAPDPDAWSSIFQLIFIVQVWCSCICYACAYD